MTEEADERKNALFVLVFGLASEEHRGGLPVGAFLSRYGDLVLLFFKVWELFETILFFSQKVTVWRRISLALSGDLFRTSVNLNKTIVYHVCLCNLLTGA